MDLADDVEVEIINVVERGQHVVGFPTTITKRVAQLVFRRIGVIVVGAEDEQERGAVAAQRETRQLPPGRRIGDVGQLVARPVTVDHAGRHLAAQVALEVALGPEDQAAHVGVQPVGADHQVEIARGAAREAEAYPSSRSSTEAMLSPKTVSTLSSMVA